MLAFLKGKIVDKDTTGIVIDVHNVGYHLYVSSYTLDRVILNSETKIYTYMKISQDDLSLFGFYSLEEKSMFLKLISVSSVGAKAALSILSSISLNSLAIAIATQDVKTLTNAKGIGKKTAERIILELKEKISITEAESIELSGSNFTTLDGDTKDAIEALKALGFSASEAYIAVSSAKNKSNTIEELIQLALRGLK